MTAWTSASMGALIFHAKLIPCLDGHLVWHSPFLPQTRLENGPWEVSSSSTHRRNTDGPMTAEHLEVWLFCFDFLELESEARTLHI